MFKRHFLALLITLSIYNIPAMLYNVSGYAEWLDAAVWSCIYCLLIYKFSKIRMVPLLLAAESFAIVTIFGAFIEMHIVKQEGVFSNNFESIINACYLAELIIIAIGVLNGGAVKRVHRLWLSLLNSNSHFRGSVFLREKLI